MLQRLGEAMPLDNRIFSLLYPLIPREREREGGTEMDADGGGCAATVMAAQQR